MRLRAVAEGRVIYRAATIQAGPGRFLTTSLFSAALLGATALATVGLQTGAMNGAAWRQPVPPAPSPVKPADTARALPAHPAILPSTPPKLLTDQPFAARILPASFTFIGPPISHVARPPRPAPVPPPQAATRSDPAPAPAVKAPDEKVAAAVGPAPVLRESSPAATPVAAMGAPFLAMHVVRPGGAYVAGSLGEAPAIQLAALSGPPVAQVSPALVARRMGPRGPLVFHFDSGSQDTDVAPKIDNKPVRQAGKQLQVTVPVGPRLERSLARAKIPRPVIAQLIAAARLDPDFPRRPRAGSTLTIAYAPVIPAKRGRPATGGFMSAVLDDGHRQLRLDRAPAPARATEPAQTTQLATREQNDDVPLRGGGDVEPVTLTEPVVGARITSGFGWRIHPILRVRKFHYGVDFGAPRGTPVRAAADAVVVENHWRPVNGYYVRLRHDNRLETTYSHLDKFAANLHPGQRVHKGEVIAYVGATGLATGPHLYYEVLVDGQAVSPLQNRFVLPARAPQAQLNDDRRPRQVVLLTK